MTSESKELSTVLTLDAYYIVFPPNTVPVCSSACDPSGLTAPLPDLVLPFKSYFCHFNREAWYLLSLPAGTNY